jgi:hypothetical protein
LVAGSANQGITFTEGEEEGKGPAVAFVGSAAAQNTPKMAANLALHEIAAHVIGLGHPTGTLYQADLTREELKQEMGIELSLMDVEAALRENVTKRLGP